MKKQKMGIVFKVLIIMLIVESIFINNSYASTWENIFDTGQNFINQGKNSNIALNTGGMKEIQDEIYNILLSLGIVVMVIVGAVLGITYMFGSIDQQVKVKETFIPYLIGCIVIFLAFGIWKLVVNIISTIV